MICEGIVKTPLREWDCKRYLTLITEIDRNDIERIDGYYCLNPQCTKYNERKRKDL
ncbi:unnamed protein product [marine sediment metagenome]|uniref:Uncharacterized protein n=1 Tax=marine sediment metagenome TaxID=412755 RepID=X0WTM9_9ZZZZ